MGKVKAIAGAVVLGLALIFTLQNLTTVEIVFLFWSFSLSRALLLLLIFCAGVILGWLLPRFPAAKRD